MKPMHLFSPLRKQPGFPTTSVNLTIADVKYDLVLPAEISNQLLVHFIGSEDSYRRVDRYCNAEGMDVIRAHPTLLSDEYRGLPTFAVSFYGVEDAEDDDNMNGWVALRLLVSGLAARQLYHRAHRREFITQELADYILSHDAYFEQCGGFELLRIRYYFDAEDRYTVMVDLDRDEPPSAILREGQKTKSRFRDSSVERQPKA